MPTISLNGHKSELLSALQELIARDQQWQGTALELCEALHLGIVPRSLVVRLKKTSDQLTLHGIELRFKKVKGAHIIMLSHARKAPSTATNHQLTLNYYLLRVQQIWRGWGKPGTLSLRLDVRFGGRAYTCREG